MHTPPPRLSARSFRRGVGALVVLASVCTGPDAAMGQGVDRRDLETLIDSIAESAIHSGGVAGMTVGVARGSETLLLRAYGQADMEGRVATAAGAIYEIGSITKQFTAAAILELMEQGSVGLDDPITDYLPELPEQHRTITLRHLLHHTAGIPDFTELPGFQPLVARRAPLDSIVSLFANEPLLFAPGSAMAYSNSGYVLLGLVIEQVSGMGFSDYIEEHLFAPAGMADSSYCSPTDRRRRRTVGHAPASGELRPTQALEHSWPAAAGSLCSSAADLIVWNRALHGGDILPPDAYRALVTAGSLDDGTHLRYAAGLMLDSIRGQASMHHGGSLPGFRSALAYFPQDELTIVVLINTYGGVSPAIIEDAIAGAFYRWRAPRPRPLDRPPAEIAGSYAGIGRTGLKKVEIAAGSDGALTVRVDGRAPEPLVHVGGNRFVARQSRLTRLDNGSASDRIRWDEVAENVVLTRVP